jgi:hypothetical protein
MSFCGMKGLDTIRNSMAAIINVMREAQKNLAAHIPSCFRWRRLLGIHEVANWLMFGFLARECGRDNRLGARQCATFYV